MLQLTQFTRNHWPRELLRKKLSVWTFCVSFPISRLNIWNGLNTRCLQYLSSSTSCVFFALPSDSKLTHAPLYCPHRRVSSRGKLTLMLCFRHSTQVLLYFTWKKILHVYGLNVVTIFPWGFEYWYFQGIVLKWEIPAMWQHYPRGLLFPMNVNCDMKSLYFYNWLCSATTAITTLLPSTGF